MRVLIPLAMLIVYVAPTVVTAQTAATQEITPEMARTEKREIVARNLQLTAQDARRFWPVYEAYQRQLQRWNARMARLIEEYVHHYDGLSNAQAQRLVEEFVALNEQRARLQRSYLPKFEKVVPATRVVRYYHIEHKLYALTQYELATVIPLMK